MKSTPNGFSYKNLQGKIQKERGKTCVDFSVETLASIAGDNFKTFNLTPPTQNIKDLIEALFDEFFDVLKENSTKTVNKSSLEFLFTVLEDCSHFQRTLDREFLKEGEKRIFQP